ncbi:hypothetical protein HOD20_06775 [archaeon]|jgi:hypothetical protein|nr:hypothetical protein [archaeon]MBT4352208.1 hypothetical protein [archaeon]MBT4647331.1 hypothetical protein [archaeon]MBT6821233.1 hypothetical protein [archaeon]MBT7391285.1 hypothetical protein [archaeon]
MFKKVWFKCFFEIKNKSYLLEKNYDCTTFGVPEAGGSIRSGDGAEVGMGTGFVVDISPIYSEFSSKFGTGATIGSGLGIGVFEGCESIVLTSDCSSASIYIGSGLARNSAGTAQEEIKIKTTTK